MRYRLIDLNPRWLDLGHRKRMGIEFLCPCENSHALNVWFQNPIDGLEAGTLDETRQMLYQREGTTFEDLTVYPPIMHDDCMLVLYGGQINMVYIDD